MFDHHPFLTVPVAPNGLVPHCGKCGNAMPCACSGVITQPAAPAPVAPRVAPKANVVTRYGIDYCVICGYAIQYCPGHSAPNPPAKDSAESDLVKRIRDARGGR